MTAPTGRRDWRRAGRLLAFALAVGGVIVAIPVVLWHLQTDPLADAHAYYLAGQRLNSGTPLYHQPGATIAETYLYPPLLAILWRPLALLPMEVALAIWEGVILGALLVTLRSARHDGRVWAAAGILALPIGWAVAIGQAEVAVAALLSLATPFTVALAGSLKIFPWVAAIFWLITGDRQRFTRFVAWALGLLGVQLILEPSNTVAYLRFEWLQPVLGVRSFSPLVIHPIAYLAVFAGLSVAVVRFRTTAAAWPLTVVLVVLSYPRLLLYQLTTLLAAFGAPAGAGRRQSPIADAAITPRGDLSRTAV